MGLFDGIFKRIPFVSRFSKKKEPVNNVELQLNKAMNLMDNGEGEESVTILEQVVDIGIMDTNYKSYGNNALLALSEFFEKGVYRNAKTQKDLPRAAKYLEKYISQNHDGDLIYKLAKIMLEIQNFTKALKYYELAATDYGIKAAYMALGSIYETGLNRIDEFGNKSDFVVPVDYEKSMMWYKKLADAGDAKAKASYERVEYASTHEDSLEFEEKDKLYTEISEKRKEKGKEPRYKVIEASRLQYQYSYVHNQVEGFIHKIPKDWVKTIDESTGEEYYAPSLTYKDFAIYVYYDSIPKESKKTLENYLRYCNDAFDEEMQLKAYVTEYADGICTTFYHKDMEKGIVSFAFYQGRRLACMRFVCASMEIVDQYEEIIFETANSFAFIDPTLVSDESANRRDMQYYNEAIYCYYLEDYEGAMKAAKQALKFGSIKASYLLVELYYDEESPYRDLEKTISYAKQLFDATKDPELAFLIGNVYDFQMKDYMKAINWYENAERLGHKRVAFYLGRIYYYGLLRTKRDDKKALAYFTKAKENGIPEAKGYIEDLKELGGEDLQTSIEKWERAVQNGSEAAAIKIAMMKQRQIFYIATPYEIEKAYLEALGLGNAQAGYELGRIYQLQEKQENFKGEIKSIKYFEKAFNANYDDWDKENLFKVINYKVEKGLAEDEAIKLYIENASMGYVPAIDKLTELVFTTTQQIWSLYDALIELAETGDETAIVAMNKLEMSYVDLVIREPEKSQKVVENKFFRLCVPKECTATIDDNGGTIKLADSVVEFAVAELPVNANDEKDYLRIYKLIVSEYLPDENAEVIIANSRMIGSAIKSSKDNVHTYSILLISSKNQYIFKLSSKDRRQLMQFKDVLITMAKSLVETGEIYKADGEDRKNIGLAFLLRASDEGFLSIGKDN